MNNDKNNPGRRMAPLALVALLLAGALPTISVEAEVCTPPVPDPLNENPGEPVCDTDLPICEEGVEGACGEDPPEPCDPTPGGKVPGDYPACPLPPPPCAPGALEQPWEDCQPTPDPCQSGCDPCDEPEQPCDVGPLCGDGGGCDVGPCDPTVEGDCGEPECDPTTCIKEAGDCEDKAYPVVCDEEECDGEGANAAGGLCDDPCDAPENPCDPSDPCPGNGAETWDFIEDQPAINLNENLTDCDVTPELACPVDVTDCIRYVEENFIQDDDCSERREVGRIQGAGENYAILYVRKAGSNHQYSIDWVLDPDTITVGVDRAAFVTGISWLGPDGPENAKQAWQDEPQGACQFFAYTPCNVPVTAVKWGLQGGVAGTAGSTTHQWNLWAEASATAQAEARLGLTDVSAGASVSVTLTLGGGYTYTDGTVFDSELLMGAQNVPLHDSVLNNPPASNCLLDMT